MISYAVNTSKTQLSPVRFSLFLMLMRYEEATKTEKMVFHCEGELAEFIEGERVRIHAQKGKGHTSDSNSEEFTRLCYGIQLAYELGQTKPLQILASDPL